MKIPNLTGEITAFDRVKPLEILAFTKHVSLMLKSGLTLPEAIRILEKQTSHTAFKIMLKTIHQELANGQQLHGALALFPRNFDSFYLNLVKIAEESGSLEKNLDYLAAHLKKQHEFSSKVRSALLYPSIVMGVAVFVAIGLSTFVLPKLIDLFSSLDVELPLSTRMLLSVAAIMRDFGVAIIIFLGLMTTVFRYAITTNTYKPFWHRFIVSLPVLGTLIQNIELASLFRNLGTMLGVGLPLSTAIDSQYVTTSNTVYKRYIGEIQSGIRKGKSIESIFEGRTHKYMPLVAVKMIGVGEKTGKLDETFVYLGEYFENEVDDATKNLSTVLEPLILIIVGLIVAFIALSIIGPIYQFTGSVKR